MELYKDLQDRVEAYFDYELHLYLEKKGRITCSKCFLPMEHPLHINGEMKMDQH